MTSPDEYSLIKTFASLPRTTRGLPTVLGGSPKGDTFLYTNGTSVFIVKAKDLTNVEIYTEHPLQTTVAKLSPSGYYVASGDTGGNVRIWDATQPTHILKATYPIISAQIRDISWSDDSKRLAVVGEGRERFGHVFLFDTGTSNGNLSGQSRAMSSIDFRPTRPYRLVSGSEDNTVAIFEGPPFKFKTLFHEHTRFVHVVRYNADGSLFASASADGKVVLFEGTDGTKVGELKDDAVKGGNAHAGGVFGLAWSPDGSRIATASGDKTVKIWNVASKSLEKTVTFGNAIEDQQLSVLWIQDALLSVSLSGFINYINPELGQVEKVAHGHNKPITALAISADKSVIFTADFEGHITRWSTATGESKRVTPALHKSQVSGLVVTDKGTLVSVGWDDTIQFTPDALGNIEGVRPTSTKLSSQPAGVASDGTTTVVAGHKSISIFNGEKLAADHPIQYNSSSVALHPGKKIIAVGGQDAKVHVYSLSGTAINEVKTLTHSGPITSVSFTADGKLLAATDSSRKVIPYNVDSDYSIASAKEWTFHTARVNCNSWNPSGRFLATGGLDTNVIVWDMTKTGDHPVIIKNAHTMSPINGVVWLDEKTFITVGQDANVKTWKVNVN